MSPVVAKEDDQYKLDTSSPPWRICCDSAAIMLSKMSSLDGLIPQLCLLVKHIHRGCMIACNVDYPTAIVFVHFLVHNYKIRSKTKGACLTGHKHKLKFLPRYSLSHVGEGIQIRSWCESAGPATNCTLLSDKIGYPRPRTHASPRALLVTREWKIGPLSCTNLKRESSQHATRCQ